MLKRNTWEALPLVLNTFEAAEVMRCHPETVKRLFAAVNSKETRSAERTGRFRGMR